MNLVYIGYCGLLNEAVELRKPKIKDLLKESKKKVFHCYIIGGNQCGKVISFLMSNPILFVVNFFGYLYSLRTWELGELKLR
jgi:hypothetical protein